MSYEPKPPLLRQALLLAVAGFELALTTLRATGRVELAATVGVVHILKVVFAYWTQASTRKGAAHPAGRLCRGRPLEHATTIPTRTTRRTLVGRMPVCTMCVSKVTIS